MPYSLNLIKNIEFQNLHLIDNQKPKEISNNNIDRYRNIVPHRMTSEFKTLMQILLVWFLFFFKKHFYLYINNMFERNLLQNLFLKCSRTNKYIKK